MVNNLPAVSYITIERKYYHWSIGEVIVLTNPIVNRFFYICTWVLGALRSSPPLITNMEKSFYCLKWETSILSASLMTSFASILPVYYIRLRPVAVIHFFRRIFFQFFGSILTGRQTQSHQAPSFISSSSFWSLAKPLIFISLQAKSLSQCVFTAQNPFF